jgi:hypothetical protein
MRQMRHNISIHHTKTLNFFFLLTRMLFFKLISFINLRYRKVTFLHLFSSKKKRSESKETVNEEKREKGLVKLYVYVRNNDGSVLMVC